jgi:hypothetical protein
MIDFYWVDIFGRYRDPDTKAVLDDQDLSDDAQEVEAPPGERSRSASAKKRKRKRKRPNHLQGGIGAIAHHEWDDAIIPGVYVFLESEHVPNVYQVIARTDREIYPEDMFNNPHLQTKRLSVGDAYCPVLRVKQTHDFYLNPVSERDALQYDIDAIRVRRITDEWLSDLQSRIQVLKDLIAAVPQENSDD